MQGVIHQISVSRGGVPKLPVLEATVGELGLEGDGHNEPLTVHGGPERAVCLFAVERIEALAAEGHSISPGSVGENITTRGIDWDEVTPGTEIELGEQVRLEVTRYTTPCSTIRKSFSDGNSNRIHQNLHPGWSRVYTKVLTGGVIRPGDRVRILSAVSVPPRV
jgi:MOSC domain-containing protein YiiM